MKSAFVLLALILAQSAAAADGAWIAFFRDGDRSVAFERASITNARVNLLNVSPKKMSGGVVYAWDIKTEVHQFECGKSTYRILDRRIFDEKGKLIGDETHVVTAMNHAFKDRVHPVDTDALRKAQSLACGKAEPEPAKPFASMAEALAWMAN